MSAPILFLAFYVAMLLALALVLRVRRYFVPNWRWNERAWRDMGVLAKPGAGGVLVRGRQWGSSLRDRGWGTIGDGKPVGLGSPYLPSIFRDGLVARAVVARLDLTGGIESVIFEPVTPEQHAALEREHARRSRAYKLRRLADHYRMALGLEWVG